MGENGLEYPFDLEERYWKCSEFDRRDGETESNR